MLLSSFVRAIRNRLCLSQGQDQLTTAIENQDIERLHTLLEANPRVAHPDPQRLHFPLVSAASRGFLEGVQALLPHGHANVRNAFGYSALSGAAAIGHAGIIALLLDQPGIETTGSAQEPRTPLMLAAETGRDECVQLLLPVSDPKAQSANGETALFFAVLNAHLGCAQILAAHSDANARASNGFTPLMMLAALKHHDRRREQAIARVLLPYTNLWAINPQGLNALQEAQKHFRLDLCDLFLDAQSVQDVQHHVPRHLLTNLPRQQARIERSILVQTLGVCPSDPLVSEPSTPSIASSWEPASTSTHSAALSVDSPVAELSLALHPPSTSTKPPPPSTPSIRTRRL